MTITFDKLPNNLEELKAMPQATLNEPEYTAALFIAVMMHYTVNKEETFAMLEYLKGPYGLSSFEKQFLADRMSDGKDYVVRSFFNGTSPENDYTPSMPYTIETERGFDQEIEGRMNDIIEFSELGDFIDEPIRTYSSGMYMRLAFSIAINVDAEILLIDEILAVGDQNFQEKCFAKLRELKASDKTIVIVSHSLDVVKDLCTRAIWIYKGHFRLDGNPDYVIDEYLKQLALDNIEHKRRLMAEGGGRYKGIITFDEPKNYIQVAADDTVRVRGWKISDCENAEFVIRVGKREFKAVENMARQDVINVFAEEYGGFMDEETTGFVADINFKDFADQIENGKVVITASLTDEKQNVITERSLSLSIRE